MTVWKPAVKPRAVHGATVQTVRAGITNETGHDVAVGDRTLRVLPDGRTTSRKRSCIITDALAAIEVAETTRKRLKNGDSIERVDPVAYVAGSLLVAGATNLWLDGQPLTPSPAVPAADLRITPTGDGLGIEVRLLNGGERT